MKLYIFLSICIACLSAPVIDQADEVMEKKEEKVLTMDVFDGYLDMLKMFRGMLPQDLMNTIDNLNLTQKGELVNFMTDWYNGRIKRPENKAEIVELIKEKLPTVYEKIDYLNTTFYNKFLQLKPETQQLLRSWRDKAISLEGETPAESTAKKLQLLRDVALSVQTMNNETKEDIRSQFPTAVNLTEDEFGVDYLRYATFESDVSILVSNGFGFTVLTTLAMIVQKIMESFAVVATTLAPQAAQECPIPV